MAPLPGRFLEPDRTLEALADPNTKLKIPVRMGHRATDHVAHLKGSNQIFDEICDRLAQLEIAYDDQCSSKYYHDLVVALEGLSGQYNRIVDVGVFMGGSSAIFAGLMSRFDFALDLVDINADYLRFTYERIRRLYPEAASRVRLFHGTLPYYVRNVLRQEAAVKCIVHHDASHEFTQVVKDLASLYFVRDKLLALIVQDTNLRGTKHMNFVDMAAYAVFGTGLSYVPMGIVHSSENQIMTNPNRFEGNYSLAGVSEGMLLPLSANKFHYPHPDSELELLL